MRRLALPFVALALVSSGCASTLGRSVPECDAANATMILAIQSVPGSQFVSCIAGLKAGWKYQDLKAEAGRSTYTLDSDRMGDEFLLVENSATCDVGDAVTVGAVEADGDAELGIELWKDVNAETQIEVVVVPEGPNSETTSRAFAIDLALEDLEIKGQTVVVKSSGSVESTQSRIEAAAASGAHVIIISIRDAEEGTLTVLAKGSTAEVSVDSVDDAVELIEAAENEASYRGNWYYVFDGGCVVYTFDAQGQGVATIDEDIQAALSLYDAESLRQGARDAGYQIP